MADTATYQVVTANRMRDGIPVYFAGKGAWSPQIGDAAYAAKADALLNEAQTHPLAREAIDPYIIDVSREDGMIRPIGLREQIRAFGPTA